MTNQTCTKQKPLFWYSNTYPILSFGICLSGVDFASAHARYYEGKNHIWLSNDPMSIEEFASSRFLFDPQGQNSYSYVKNNPINNIDPDGRATWEFVTGQQNWPDYREESRVYLQNEVDQGTFIGNAFVYPGLYGAAAGGGVYMAGTTAVGYGAAKGAGIAVGVATTFKGGYDAVTQTKPNLGAYVNLASEAGTVGGFAGIGVVRQAPLLWTAMGTVASDKLVSNEKISNVKTGINVGLNLLGAKYAEGIVGPNVGRINQSTIFNARNANAVKIESLQNMFVGVGQTMYTNVQQKYSSTVSNVITSVKSVFGW